MAVSPFPCPTCVSDLVSVFTGVSVASQPPQVTHLQGPRGNQNIPSSFLLPVQSKEAEGGCLGSSLTPSCVRVLAAQSQPPPGARALIGSPLAAQNRFLSRCNFFFRSVLQLLLPGGHTVWRAVLRGKAQHPNLCCSPRPKRGSRYDYTGLGGVPCQPPTPVLDTTGPHCSDSARNWVVSSDSPGHPGPCPAGF